MAEITVETRHTLTLTTAELYALRAGMRLLTAGGKPAEVDKEARKHGAAWKSLAHVGQTLRTTEATPERRMPVWGNATPPPPTKG